jgi:hypothetical protein
MAKEKRRPARPSRRASGPVVPYLVASIEHAFAIGEMIKGGVEEGADLLAMSPPFTWLNKRKREQAISAAGGESRLRQALKDLRRLVGWSPGRFATVYFWAKQTDTANDDRYRIGRVTRRRHQRQTASLASRPDGARVAAAARHVSDWALRPGASSMINRVRGRLRYLGLEQATIARLEFAWLFQPRQGRIRTGDGFVVGPPPPWPRNGLTLKEEFERLRNQIKQAKPVPAPPPGVDSNGLPMDTFDSLSVVVRARDE